MMATIGGSRFWYCLLYLLAVSVASAADSAEKPYGFGKMYVGFQVGYGSGFTLGNSGTGDTKDVSYIATLPSFAIGVSDPMAMDSWYGGNFDFVAEGEFITLLGPGGGHTAGLAILMRYNFLAAGDFVPYAELGVGAGYIQSDLRDQADGLAFYPQGGVGLDYFVSDHWALSLSYRYHHISNRSTKKPNNGINANLGLFGVKYHFD